MEHFDYGALEPAQQWQCDCVRNAVDHLRKVIEQNVIDSPEKAIAMQKVEECLMWADRGIAGGGRDGCR